MLVWFICLEISEKRRGREGVGVYFRPSGPGKEGGETSPEGTTSLSIVRNTLNLIPSDSLLSWFGSEPRREVPSVILSLEHLPSPKSK